MEVIEVKSKNINPKEFKARYAIEDDAKRNLKQDCLLVEDGRPTVLYKKIDWCDTLELRNVCKDIRYNKDVRLPKMGRPGITTRSAIFGYRPRIPLRQDFCSATSMATGQQREHQVITDFAANLAKIYEEYFPDTYAKHKAEVEQRVKDEWRIGNSVFTSGIVNNNNPLQYHTDTGNFKGMMSNMIAFRDGIFGGRLVLPEYDVKLEIADNTITIFNGQDIVHGVTPLKKFKPNGYRYTIVYYSLEQMWKCDGINEEVQRIRKLKKEREMRRTQLHNSEENSE
jgi:hypothetical protein